MSTRDRVTSFLVGMLRELLGITVIQAKQDYAIKFDKYITVDLLNERSLGDFERWDVDNELIYIECLREATFNVQAYGVGSVELLATIWGELQRPTIVDEFYIANISVTTVGDVQDLSELMDNRSWQERASIDLTVSYDRTAVDSPEWFNVVRINSIFIDELGNKVSDERVDVVIDDKTKEMNQFGEHRQNCKC